MITQIDGWWWPEADRRARPVIVGDAGEAVASILKHIEGRTCIVQAGGNVGVYPLALADHFRRVITAEPDPINAQCLWKNLAARDTFKRVDARQAAFGPEIGDCAMVEVEPDNCGAHRVEAGGKIVVLPIDALGLLACDAIWLDVEGSELAALKGAEETIAKFRPTIAVEDKGLGAAYGIAAGELQAWIEARGYGLVAEIGNDKVFKRIAP